MTQVQTPRKTSPIEIADATWNGRPSTTGWYAARCTGHDDSHASLSYREAEDGGIILKCHAGCERAAIIAGAGLTEKEMHPRGTYRPRYIPRPKYDLISLAHDKLLPWQFLFNEGVTDGYKYHGSEVCKISYYDFLGEEYSKVRIRQGPSGNKDSRWDEDTPGLPGLYGLHKHEMAHEKGYGLIGEGESDAWTCWYHDIPYMGCPGATATDCLDGSLLNDIPALYVIQEPDAAGQNFYKRVHQRLRETGYTGKMYALPWQKLTGWKDPNELHRMIRLKDPNDTHAGFQAAIAKALERATLAGDDIELSVSRMDEQEWVPRADYDELKEQYQDVRAQRDFMLQVLAVPDAVMKPPDKLLNIWLDHKMRNGATNKKGFIPVNLGEASEGIGMGYTTAGRSKARLIDTVGLYEQDSTSFFKEGPNRNPIKEYQTIALRPTLAQQYPRLYDSSNPVIRGGKKTKKETPVCPNCQSENVDIYEGHICHDCHDTGYKPVSLAPASDTPRFLDDKPTIVEVLPASVQEDAEQAKQEEVAPFVQLERVLVREERLVQVERT